MKLDSCGPVLLRQLRVGRDGRVFEMMKLRTMVPDRRFRAGPPPGLGSSAASTNQSLPDLRVTHVGCVLGSSSLDELPQLLQRAEGEMSLVGARPELPEIVARYEPW